LDGASDTSPKYKLDDRQLASTLGLKVARWHYLKRLILNPPRPSQREYDAIESKKIGRYLIYQPELRRMCTLTLKQRAAFANLKHNTRLMTVYRVRKIFKEFGISHKAIRTRNAPPAEDLEAPKYQLLHIIFR